MRRSDLIALFISLAALAAAVFVSTRIYEGIPHIEDEISFAWQARVIERGQLSAPVPPTSPRSFLVAFVVAEHGQRFSKYPIGWPVLLAIGERLGARWLVNPLLTALAVWWIYRLVSKLAGEQTALLAALLGSTSPFLWMNSGTLLSHPWTLLLSVVFCAAWLDAFPHAYAAQPVQSQRRLHARFGLWLPAISAGLSLGMLAITRPWTAIGIAAPFIGHGFYLFVKGSPRVRLRLAVTALLAAGVAALLFAWQYAVTGSPWTNPYLLWWPYDRVGLGPGHGLAPGGHTLAQALDNTVFSLFVANTDLFGWPLISWLFMPFGLLALRRSRRTWLVSLTLPSLVLAYALYWTPSWLYGPRYYYEALLVPLLLTAAGIRWLAGSAAFSQPAANRWPRRIRLGLTAALVGLLMGANLLYYLPMRVGSLRGVSYTSARCLAPFATQMAQDSIPALVFVHLQEHWAEYGCLQDLNSPFFDGDFVIAIGIDLQTDAQVQRLFPGRTVLHYYAHPPSLISQPAGAPIQ